MPNPPRIPTSEELEEFAGGDKVLEQIGDIIRDVIDAEKKEKPNAAGV